MLQITSNTVSAQINLVPNPSFEVYDTCPSYYAPTYRSIYNAVPWFQPNQSLNSTDYFNSCSIDTILSLSVPNNYEGYQLPHFGDGYAGIGIGIFQPQNNTREYLEIELNDTLQSGNEYCITYYVSFANKSKTACDGLGAFVSISKIIYYSQQFYLLSLPAQISNSSGNIISDTLNWIKISGSFFAGGGEKYLTIGNFKDDAHTNFIRNGYGSHLYSYYYIDDVSIVSGNCTVGLKNHNQVNNVTIFPNPVNENIYFQNLPSTTNQILIYDVGGRLLIHQKNISSLPTLQKINVSELVSGIYFVKVITDDGSTTRKIIKE